MMISMSRDWANGSTREWRELRLRVLERDAYRCQLKHAECTTVANHVHHLDGKGNGDDPTRLVAACEWCNLHEGKPQGDPQPRSNTAW